MGYIENRLSSRLADSDFAQNIVTRRMVRIVTTVATIVVVWQLAASVFFNPQILPSPVAVLFRLPEILESSGPRQASALFHLRVTLTRVAIVTAISMSAALVLGLAMSVNKPIEDIFTTLLPFWMTFPTVVVVLVTMIMFNFSQLSVISAAVVTTTPYAAVSIWEGTKNIDRDLIEMATAFGSGTFSTWRHIYIPSVMPSLFSSFRYLFSMVWKIVVIAEVFGIENGMGAQFRFWFSESSVVTLLAYLMLFLAVMFSIEYGAIYPIESRVFRWRD